MFNNRETSIRILATSIAVLLTIALFVTHTMFWMDFLVGIALGLTIGLVAIVWNKNAGDEIGNNRKPVELNLSR